MPSSHFIRHHLCTVYLHLNHFVMKVRIVYLSFLCFLILLETLEGVEVIRSRLCDASLTSFALETASNASCRPRMAVVELLPSFFGTHVRRVHPSHVEARHCTGACPPGAGILTYECGVDTFDFIEFEVIVVQCSDLTSTCVDECVKVKVRSDSTCKCFTSEERENASIATTHIKATKGDATVQKLPYVEMLTALLIFTVLIILIAIVVTFSRH